MIWSAISNFATVQRLVRDYFFTFFNIKLTQFFTPIICFQSTPSPHQVHTSFITYPLLKFDSLFVVRRGCRRRPRLDMRCGASARALVLLNSLEMLASKPPLNLPFMFSPIYRINVIADFCHTKVPIPQGLPGRNLLAQDPTQCSIMMRKPNAPRARGPEALSARGQRLTLHNTILQR